MKVFIKEIILWSRKFPGKTRKLLFEGGKVNVITGNSQTGKSAIIPIIDYCLCSSYCRIPVGIIRNSCTWFGVLFGIRDGGNIFVARKSPEGNRPSPDIYLAIGPEISFPEAIEPNTTIEDTKAKLNSLFGFPFAQIDDHESGKTSPRPSFRDVISLCFQPQNIIANPDVFFYKCNEAIYAERLSTIFPFLLNAVTANWFSEREELKILFQQLRELERELQLHKRSQTSMAIEAKAKLLKAKSLSIYNNEIYDATIEHYIIEIEKLVKSRNAIVQPRFDDKQSQKIINDISNKEKNLSLKYSDCKQRMKFIDEVQSLSGGSTANTLRRRGHFELSNELLRQHNKNMSCPFCGSESNSFLENMSSFFSEAIAFEEERKKWGMSYNIALDQERLTLLTELRGLEEQISAVEKEKNAFMQEKIERRKHYFWIQAVNSFLGELTEFVNSVKGAHLTTNIHVKIEVLTKKVNRLKEKTSSDLIRKRTEHAINSISEIAHVYSNYLGAEWQKAQPRLDIKNLTVSVARPDGIVFLHEIGSGSNWLAYHLGFMLGVHEYAIKQSKYIPSFVVFDQPTQVYFLGSTQIKIDGSYWDIGKGNDIEKSNNIFKLLDEYVEKNNGHVQILLCDHAPKEMFSIYKNTVIVDEWRERKLIPAEWEIH